MTLKELKVPFQNIVDNADAAILSYGCNDIADMYNNTSDAQERNLYVSILICRAWNILQNMFYKDNAGLSEEECYDIFLETISLVLEKSVWHDENSSIYQDEDAFLKAMNTAARCARINYVIAQHRQKRMANCNALSLDGLNENCSDGYFTPYDEDPLNSDSYIVEEIQNYFKRKDYLTSFVLDAIINLNVYSNDNDLDMRKLRKHLRSMGNNFMKKFASRYNLNFDEVKYSKSYFSHLSQANMDKQIYSSLYKLRNNKAIREGVSVC